MSETDLKPGATGEFPQGKLNEHDEGEMNIRMDVTREGVVIMDFGKATAWVGFGPDEADAFAAKLTELAVAAREQLKKNGN